MQWLTRVLVFTATLYLTFFVILWSFQSHFIYPAPQSVARLTPGYTEVNLQTADGLSLRSFYRAADEGQPTVVYFHGNGGTLEAASISNAAFARAGFGVLMVEYRGYGGNPGEPSEEGFYQDGDAAMAWLAGEGLPASDIVIVANSIGGGVGTEMALRYDPKALVLIAPFTSLPAIAQDKFWWLPARHLVTDQYDNAAKIGELEMPILIQHGTEDLVVPYDHGQGLAALVPSAQFQTFEGVGHGLSFAPQSQLARRDWILGLEDQNHRQIPAATSPSGM